MKNNKILYIVLFLVVIGGGLFFFLGNKDTQEEAIIPNEEAQTTTTVAGVVNCGGDDANCVFTNVIGNFTNDCQPVKVFITMDTTTNEQVTITLSKGENGACRFQFEGLGIDQDCLFAKENVKQEVIKGLLGMDNIPNDPAFQKIKAASCK